MKFVCLTILFNSLLGQTSLNIFSSQINQSTCNYPYYEYMCGDICLGYAPCTCGDTVINPPYLPPLIKDKVPYCCTPPSVQCKRKGLNIYLQNYDYK